MFVKPSNVVIVALLGFSMAACSGSEPDAGQITEEAPAAVPTLASATSAGLRNARQPMDHMVTGGQPSEVQVAQLVDAGFDRFISLRPTSEDGAGWEEAGLGAGASFARLPIRGGAELTRENVEALDALLSDSDGEDTVLYCASGNRVGALLALRAAWLQDMPADEAIALGRAAGMTRLESVVMELLGVDN
jgi:uncharacterized protein (TIGR01244 family)